MKISKAIKVTALALTLVSGMAVFPNSAAAETLGWSEETGYVYHQGRSASPNSHSATIESFSSSLPNTQRVVATTRWNNVRHFSRARFQRIATGAIQGDSGRVWGTGVTTARSGFVERGLVNPGLVARSYWGT